MNIDQMKVQLENTSDQIGKLLQMLSEVNQEEKNSTRPVRDFLLSKLGVLTDGQIGYHPDNAHVVVEPLD